MKYVDLAFGAACVLALVCVHSSGAVIEVNESGSLQLLGRTQEENLLAGPVHMRILERQFSEQADADGPKETDRKVVVATQSDLFDAALQPATKRELRLVIDDPNVKAETVKRKGGSVTVAKSDKEAELSWTSVFTPKEGGLEIAVTFTNAADRLRSFDVEFPIPLAGTDYDAFFPGANDFPEWPDDGALGYQLRAGQWEYNSLSQPLATFFSKARDVGVSVASSYARPILPITFFAARAKGHTAVLATFVRVRLDPDGERTIRLYLAPHAGDWRCGLAFVRETFRDSFYVNPDVSRFFTHSFHGSGALGGYYPDSVNNPRYWKNYGAVANPWRRGIIEMMGLSRWWGQYMSDVPEWTTDAQRKWYAVNKTPEWYGEEFLEGKPAEDAPWQEIIAWIESRPEHLKEQIFKKGRGTGISPANYYWYKVSKDKVREFIRVAREHNTSMFLYWNPRDVWYPYAKDKFEDLIVYRSKNYFNTDNAYVSAPKGCDFYTWHMDQFRSMFEEYPNLDGFFVDQCYAAADHVYNYDDGYTVTDDGRTASRFNSNLGELVAGGRKIAHERGKFVWGNHPHEKIDIVSNYDLTLTEGPMALGMGMEVGRYSTIANRPWVSLVYGERVSQVCLRDGAWAQLTSQARYDDYETRFSTRPLDWHARLYAPMFDLFRSKTWVLESRCLTLPEGFEGNLFRIDEEENLVATVAAFGESFTTPWVRLDVPVTIRTSDAAEVKAAYVVGAANLGAFKIPFERDGEAITVKIPQFRGASTVLLAKAGRFVSVDSTVPAVSPGGTYTFNVVADNLTDETWSWKNTVWLGRDRDWHWEEIPPGESVTKPFRITVPADHKIPFVQMRLAKDVPSRLPIEDGYENHMATFEFSVGPQVSGTLAPGRELVERTLSNTRQGGYKPFYPAHPLHIYEGETAEFDLGLCNGAARSQRLNVEIRGENVEIVEVPGLMHVPPLSQGTFKVVARGVQRGAGSLHVDLKKGGDVVSTFDLPIQVFGRTLAQADLAKVKSAALLYDLWGRTKTGGAEAKQILVNDVPGGPLVASGGYPVWCRRTRAKLDEKAAKAVQLKNVVSITNQGKAFWKIRNVMLEVKLEDGSTVHLASDPGARSFPKDHPWAEGERYDTNDPFRFGMPVVAPSASVTEGGAGKAVVKATVLCAPLEPGMVGERYESDCPEFSLKGAHSKEESTHVEFVDYDPDTVDGKCLVISTEKTTDTSLWGYKAGTGPMDSETWTVETRFRASGGQDCRVIDAPNWVPVSLSFSDGKGAYGGLSIGYNYSKEGEYPPGNVVWMHVSYPDPEEPGNAVDRKFVVVPGSKFHTYRLIATGKPHPDQPKRKELKVFVDGEYRFSLYGDRGGEPVLQWGHQRPATGSSSWDYVRWKNGAAVEPGKEGAEKWWDASYEGDEIRTAKGTREGEGQ